MLLPGERGGEGPAGCCAVTQVKMPVAGVTRCWQGRWKDVGGF